MNATRYTSALLNAHTLSNSRPAIWVGALGAYNSGDLHGAWIIVTADEDEVMEAVREVLAASPVAGEEEWEVMDSEHLPGAAGRSVAAACAYVAVLEALEETHGADAAEILEAWMDWRGEGEELDAGAISDAYLGQFETVEAYADDYLENTGFLNEVPESLRAYIDSAALGRDAELSGDIHHGTHGHTFNGHA